MLFPFGIEHVFVVLLPLKKLVFFSYITQTFLPYWGFNNITVLLRLMPVSFPIDYADVIRNSNLSLGTKLYFEL